MESIGRARQFQCEREPAVGNCQHREELDQIHDERRANHDRVVERLKLRGQIHPAVSGGEAEDRDGRIEIHARRE